VIITDSSIASQPRHLDKSSEYLIENEEIVCLGKPFPGFAIEIDSEQEDQIGNVLIKSGSIAQEMFGQEMRLDNNGFLKTDDLGFIRDGELYFAGRSDDWIVVAGSNLDARAIEQMASNHEAVRAGNCVAVIDELGTYALVAEPSDELAASISGQQSSSSGYVLDQIANEITRLIGPLSGISPSRIIFVERGKLPKTPSGKLQRRKVSLGLDRLEAKIREYWVRN
jgi:acyl-coenzyme A synthetase/AMP-(fatty) acid ligase